MTGKFVLPPWGILAVALWVIRKTRPRSQYWLRSFAAFGIFYLLVLLGIGDIVRYFIAKKIISQSQPVIAALENQKATQGYYPFAASQISIRDLNNQSDEDIKPELSYESDSESYMLSFGLDGPPLGHFFIYIPSRSYGDLPGKSSLKFKRLIGDWGWYVKS